MKKFGAAFYSVLMRKNLRVDSFLGVTLDNENTYNTYECKSVGLACCRFKNQHTAERIMRLITRVLTEYKIQNKILACTTDNGSNFVNAFNLWGVKPNNITVYGMPMSEEQGEYDVILNPFQRARRKQKNRTKNALLRSYTNYYCHRFGVHLIPLVWVSPLMGRKLLLTAPPYPKFTPVQ